MTLNEKRRSNLLVILLFLLTMTFINNVSNVQIRNNNEIVNKINKIKANNLNFIKIVEKSKKNKKNTIFLNKLIFKNFMNIDNDTTSLNNHDNSLIINFIENPKINNTYNEIILNLDKVFQQVNHNINKVDEDLLMTNDSKYNLIVEKINIETNKYLQDMFVLHIMVMIITMFITYFLYVRDSKVLNYTFEEIESEIEKGLITINKLNNEIELTQEEIIHKLGSLGETRSKETGNHVKRVREYSSLLAKYYGLPDKDIENIRMVSPMHDIGKIGIPDNILNKPGKFTSEEFELMKTHSEIGYHLFKNSKRELLRLAAVVSYKHHEKWNGKGYPRGLKGHNIHIFGRITAIADVFDALGSDRCYKKAWEDNKIFELLKNEKGKHFDPKLIDIFFEHLDEFLKIREKFKD